MKRAGRLSFGLLFALGVLPGSVTAHDFWIEPSSFQPGRGAAVALDLRFGQNFNGVSVPRNSSVIDRFVAYRGDGREMPIAGADGIAPAGVIEAEPQQTSLIVFDGAGGSVEMAAGAFEAYLRSYGLEWVVDYRALKGQMRSPGREAFHRHAKALISGSATNPAVTTAVGQPLELVPDEDPTQSSSPDFSAKVLWRGRPLSGCLVIARNRDTPAVAIRSRTSQDGAFDMQLGPGVWMLQAVWMQRGGWFSGYDWESQWASLIFQKRQAP